MAINYIYVENHLSLRILLCINFGYIAAAFATLGFKLMEYTVSENIIATTKIRNNYGAI